MKPGDFMPAWWIRNAHLQTLWGKLFRKLPAVPAETELWSAPDGEQLEIHRIKSSADKPRLVLLHGLEGSVRSHYAQGLLWQARRRGWNADLLIFRSCGSVESKGPRMYHSGETTDIAWVLERLVTESPSTPIGLAGVSLGGNVLLKYLGERGDAVASQIRAAVAISVPFDLEKSSRFIDRGFSRVYQWHFMRTLRRKARAKLLQHPGIAEQSRVDAARTMFDYDDAMTAPLHGFRDARDYYTRSSSIHHLESIGVPTLLLSAQDDPFLPESVLEDVADRAARNPRLTVEFHARGGHVGFVAGNNPLNPIYYAERRAVEFISSFVQ
jgi:predicted alpha/beta-fold hydrolase